MQGTSGGDKIMPDDYTSILDKTDWRKTIHKALEDAVMSIGNNEGFWYKVERAIQALSATYPNWDADIEVKEIVQQVTHKYNKKAEEWILAHPYEWAFPWNQDGMKKEWKNAMYLEILQNILNIAAIHRMLLWGIAESEGVTYEQLKNIRNSL